MSTAAPAIDLAPLREYCTQANALMYTEPHHFPRPLATLFALFGEENCKFSRIDDIDILRLKQSALTYSARVPATEDRREYMARAALNAMPLTRVTDMLCESLIHKDPSLAAEPFTAYAARRHASVVACKSRKRKIDRDYMSDIMAEIAATAGCAVADIGVECVRAHVHRHKYWRCLVTVNGHKYEPHVYCETSATAQHHALLNALCMLKK